MKDRYLVGHGLKNDLAVLHLQHPYTQIRDTAQYKPFRNLTKGSTPSLKNLAKYHLGIDIQNGEHDSVEDARVAMVLYRKVRMEWETWASSKKAKSEDTIFRHQMVI